MYGILTIDYLRIFWYYYSNQKMVCQYFKSEVRCMANVQNLS
nr:MAG TPA: hypothetical protein [Caudoviricetes sp.]